MAAASRPPRRAPPQRLRLLVAAVAAWLCIAGVVIFVMVPAELFHLAMFLAGICGGVALLGPFVGAELAVVVAAAGVQAGVTFFLLSEGPRETILAGAGVAVAGAGTVALARLIVRRLGELDARLATDRDIIDELSQRDGVTGALKRAQSERLLREETGRSRRYHAVFSLVILGVDEWAVMVEHEGPVQAHEQLRAIAEIIGRVVRDEDRLARHGEAEFSLILPETAVSGAEILANRLIAGVLAETSIGIRAGISGFPDDAVDPDDLVAEAESALDFARAAGVGVASSRLLRT